MKRTKSFSSVCRFAAKHTSLLISLILGLSVYTALAQDTWETLPDVPFTYGVSAGGGLATDGAFLYAADFSGDRDRDFIDVNGDGEYSPGEYLQELGIPNGSVRFARFDPTAGAWASLSALHPGGVEGDSFSAGDLTGSLFATGGKLFYYQFRAGPERCALYSYDLAQGLAGSWIEVWDITTAEALITANAGLACAEGPDGPVIFHHTGGGGYQFARSAGLTNGNPTHTLLTPSWPFSDAHFPRNGAWAYDATHDRIFHMSGDQLIQWDPSSAYAPAGFLTAVPNSTDPLAASSTAISSLKTALGWNPGGSEEHPGVSLWGNSLVVVNDPSGVAGGPGGEDTGANVLYLVRGETSADGWPFNETRGIVSNGDFARYFPVTDAAQNLPAAPFHVGKGSASCYLNGAVYLLQGETQNSPDLPGNTGPQNNDGIRHPGKGFARFVVKTGPAAGPLIIQVRDYLAAGFATLMAPVDGGSGFTPLFDQQWDSLYQAVTNNPADIIVGFSSPTAVGAARARLGDTPHTWTLDAADSIADLAGMSSFVHVFGPATVTDGAIGWAEWNAAPVTRRYWRFRVARLDTGAVEIRELELQRPKPVQNVVIDGVPVQINNLEVSPANSTVLVGSTVSYRAEASLSLGPQRYNVTTQAVWSTSLALVAGISAEGIADGIAAGETQVSATFATLADSTRLTVATTSPEDDDVSVAWIQRLPTLSYLWGSTNATRDGWPKEGSNVTWRAMVKNWYPFTRTNVGYRWIENGTVTASGAVNLEARTWTGVDLVRPWSFTRTQLEFEIDPAHTWPEFSESNNIVSTWTDAITVGFWVEDSVYNYFHKHQHELGDGANGWEDWAQRQVARWNGMFAAAVDPIDAPQGVLDRIRLDKIVRVADGALPLAGGLAGNNPDFNDRTTDLVWGFPAALIPGGMYDNHTATADWNAFFYEGSLIHELGHARYLIDCYGFNVGDSADHARIHVQHAGQSIAGTPYMPRSYPWWDHVLAVEAGNGSPFEGLMTSTYTSVDRYSAVALNRIAGRRATEGNFNAPYNIGQFINDLPASNQVQLLDAHGQPLANAIVTIYRATGFDDWYSKEFDNVPDLTFTADALGRVDVGRNPFSNEPLRHTYGISTMVALVKAEAGGRAGFAFLKAGLFNMEYWRGNTNQGRYSLVVPMLGSEREIASVHSIRGDQNWLVQVIAGGDVQPQSVVIAGETALYQEGSWRAWVPGEPGPRLVVATWPDTPPVQEWADIPTTAPVQPPLAAQAVPGEPLQLQLTWPSLLGYAFDLESSSDLLNWTLEPNSRVFGSGDPLTHLRPRSGPLQFYRLRVNRLGD